MRSKFLEAYNAVNLFRNGGLDFVGSGVPPFWTLTGATFAGTGVNNCTVVQGETPVSPAAAVNYFRLFVTSATPVVLRYVATRRFIHSAFAKDFYQVDGRAPDENKLDDPRVPRGYNKIRECQLFRGELTASWSVRVVAGAAKMTIRSIREGDNVANTQVTYPALASKDWVRPKAFFDADNHLIEAIEFVVEKVRGEVAEVHMGAFMLASGAYTVLPYTGDPMADAIPRNAIVFAVGNVCPPGFERVEPSNVPSKGRAFIRMDSVPSMDVVGSESHTHDNLVVKMEPENDWPGLVVEQGWGLSMAENPRTSIKYPADLAWEPHTHPTGPAEALPPSRDVILCKRL